MGKAEAEKRAREGGISIGELRTLIASQRGVGGISRVNRNLMKQDALDIFERALDGRKGDEVPKTLKPDPFSRSGKLRATRDHLLIKNILWECA